MPERSFRLRAVLVAALLLALGPGAVPAHAEPVYGSVSGIDGVLYDDCVPHPYRYAVTTLPDGTTTWDLRVSLIGPDGHEAGSDFVPSPTSGTSSFVLCTPADAYGTYTIRARFEWGADTVPDHSAALPDARFTLRKPSSRTTLTASTRRPAYGQVVRYPVTAYVEQPAGHQPRAFTWVHLERRKHGRWVRIRGARAMTHDTGRVVIRLRYRQHHQQTLVRAVTEGTARYSRSTSAVLRLW